MEEFISKKDLLKKLRLYGSTSVDDNTRIKRKIYNEFIKSPDLLYAINETSLEKELFNSDGTINYDGEWDLYFSDSSRDGNIRPYIFVPQTQTEVHNYICYQTYFENVPKHNSFEKYGIVTFTIMVHGDDRIDKLTGLPRHDLIGAIIKDKINWSNVFGTQCVTIGDKETITDNNYLVRTISFRIINLNNITQLQNNSNGFYKPNTINNIGNKHERL